MRALAILCTVLVAFPDAGAFAQSQQQQAQGNDQTQKTLPPDQLDSMVAPIALYPDPLLSQILVASTYPLEIVQADRWLQQNPNLKDKALTEAAAKQSWDPSVQALVVYADVLKKLDDNIGWTTDLGNAFLAQESDVMAAVQRLRQKAQQSGKLQSTEQQKVTTTTENNTQYVVIQPASPQVIYVPQYNPTVVWGVAPVYYPYPPIIYPPPPSTGAIIASSVIAFGAGLAVGAMMSGWHGWGGYGWGCGWGRTNNVVINNNFIRTNNFNRVNVSNNNAWVHNPAHRAGVPYNNRNVSNRYNAGGNYANRPNAAQAQQRLSNPGQRNPNQGNLNQRNLNQGNPAQRSQNAGQNRAGNQLSGGGARNPGQGGSDRIGNRNAGGGNFGNNGRSAFGDVNQGAARAQQNANRGASSFGGGNRGGGRRR